MAFKVEKINNCYISCSCNVTLNAADWGCNGLICYVACNAVAIYNPTLHGGSKVTMTLTGHKARVNAVRWVKNKDLSAETELVSVSADNNGLIWTKSQDTYTVSNILIGHEGSVTLVDAVYQDGEGGQQTMLVVTAAVDSTIRLWQRQGGEAVCWSVVGLDAGLCLSVCLALYEGALLLACGRDDSRVHLYTEEDGVLSRQQLLTGHDDWVTSLHFTVEDSGDLLLASGSQDASIRLWRFQPSRPCLLAGQLTVQEQQLTVGSNMLTVKLDSVLLGHDSRVYGVRWHPPVPRDDSGFSQPMKLVSASLDKTVVVWTPEETGGVWLEQARMGEVGGNTLGFYGVCFSPGGSAILAHSYQGGFYIWRKNEEGWSPGVVVGGHSGAVADLGWEPRHGRFLLSAGSDQTTRLHAPWLSGNKESSWHEMARPQVHGYDLVCLALLPGLRFVSGADEKVARVFAAPQNFLENFKRLCLKEGELIDYGAGLAAGATVPALGLSNKAVFDTSLQQPAGERHVKDQYDDCSYFIPQQLHQPPTEDTLLQNTLWPETMKLYGHGYEVFSLACTADGSLLASACRATTEEHAAILLWETSSWQRVGRLVAHQLTVTQMQFSPDDDFLLSVSRDRRWALFQKTDCDSERYKMVGRSDKVLGVHMRIIWCCAWSHDSQHFATGSRDGKVVVWSKGAEAHPILGPFTATSDYLDLPTESITSIAFAVDFELSATEYLVAVGSESGDIRLYGWTLNQSVWRFLYQLSGNFAHHLTVKRLAFRPSKSSKFSKSTDEAENIVQLASCGLDHTLKIYDVHIKCK